MKKRITLSVILALFAMVSFGQRVDLDRMYAKIYTIIRLKSNFALLHTKLPDNQLLYFYF
jgi:hypothetical protein